MKKHVRHRPRKNALTLALTAAIAVMAHTAVAVTITPVNGTISGTNTGPYNWLSGLDLSVTGTIFNGVTGVSANGNLGTLTNSGVISGSQYGIINLGTIAALTNSGSISGNPGISNNNWIGTLTNSGTISGVTGVYNFGGTIGTLANSGVILGSNSAGISNGGTIGALTNSGVISSGFSGINNSREIGVLTNSGAISGGGSGVYNTGTIGTLTNSGTISGTMIGGGTGIVNFGTIDSLTNSGTITGTGNAISNDVRGSLGPLTNSGVIAGNVVNISTNDLSINGGAGTIFGTLTGFGGGSTIGSITNTSANVVFGSGNLLLNDNINVGSHAVNNTGTAVLQVDRPITISGNYNQASSATLQIGVAGISAGQYGALTVSGDSTIASGSAIRLQSNGYAFAAGQRYVVVDTAGTAVYNPGSLVYSINGYNSTITGTVAANGSHSDLVLNVLSAELIPIPTPTPTPTPSPAIATAPNAIASLKGLLSYTGVSSPALLNLYNAALGSLSQGSGAAANRIGKQLAPTQTGWASAAPTLDALNVVGTHVNSLRLAQATGETGVATGEGPARWGAWGQAFGGHASQNERDQVDGYSANYAGLLLGVDRAISDRWRIGGAFSYSNTAINNTGDTAGNSTRVNGYGLIAYAGFTGSPWYVNLSGAVSQQQYDTTRQVGMQGYAGAANGRFSGQQYVARAEAGYPLALGSVTLTPLASLTYSYQTQGSYTESGGNGSALSVDSSHASSVKSSLGAKLEKRFSTRYGEIVPDVQAQWIHEYNHTRQVTGAGFAADPTGQTAFTTVGASPVADLADISLGVTLLRANNLSLSVRYELQMAPGFVSQTGAVRLRQRF